MISFDPLSLLLRGQMMSPPWRATSSLPPKSGLTRIGESVEEKPPGLSIVRLLYLQTIHPF